MTPSSPPSATHNTTLAEQTARGHDMRVKVPAVRNANGYSKDRFRIDLTAGTVTCPADHTVAIRAALRHRVARFGALCQSCPLQAACTTARRGRVISIHPQEAALQHAKARQREPAWQQDYRRYRPVVERKISHFTRRPWGGRKARCRGHNRILTDILARAWRHQPRPAGHPGPAAPNHRLGHRLTPPTTQPQGMSIFRCSPGPKFEGRRYQSRKKALHQRRPSTTLAQRAQTDAKVAGTRSASYS